VTNITFIFETSPNTKPKEKKWGGRGILCPPRLKKCGGHVPRVPHQIAPMVMHDTGDIRTNISAILLCCILYDISDCPC